MSSRCCGTKCTNVFEALSNAGITPSSSTTYTSSAIIAALTKVTGQAPIILCESSELYQVYYGFYTNGPLTNADFIPTTVTGSSSKCPASGVKYLPKSGGSTGPTTAAASSSLAPTAVSSSPTTTAASSSPTGTGSFSGSGYLNAYYNDNEDGCLISAGTWYTTGTCATYTATTSGSGFTLKSSKGNCGIVSGAFSCASGVSATVFTVCFKLY